MAKRSRSFADLMRLIISYDCETMCNSRFRVGCLIPSPAVIVLMRTIRESGSRLCLSFVDFWTTNHCFTRRQTLRLRETQFLKEILMPRNEVHPPPKQQVFAFARLDLWDKLPQAVRDECQRLITQQLKQSFPSQSQQENVDEREDSI